MKKKVVQKLKEIKEVQDVEESKERFKCLNETFLSALYIPNYEKR